jgi:hypothetical protein
MRRDAERLQDILDAIAAKETFHCAEILESNDMKSNSGNSDKSMNNWFSNDIKYEGQGRAEFTTPQGFIEGFTKIHFDELGNSTLEMAVDNFSAEPTLRLEFMEFFSSEPPLQEGDNVSLRGRLGTNPCTSLTVTTPQGVYSAKGQIIYNPIIDHIGTSRVQFYLITSQFDVTNPGRAKYWVLPIFNLISKFYQCNSQLDNHPLRIHPKVVREENATGAKVFLNFLLHDVDHLIIFDFNSNLGFIEPLLDFNERKNSLYSGQVQHIITAVMVGEIGSHSIDITDFRDWIPFGFLPLLSLATGSEVGIPWIEFRDANGELVRRIHDNFSKPNFSTGYATISESVHRSTGYLLSQAQSSPDYGKAPLGSVIFDLVQSSSYNLTIEDKLNKICRAFDYLCKHHQLDTQNLLLGLDQSNQDIVNTVLRSAETANSLGCTKYE